MTSVSVFVAMRIDALKHRKSVVEIAEQAGLRQPTMLRLIASGEARLPLHLVHPLAVALDCAPNRLFRMVLAENWPGEAGPLDEVLGSGESEDSVSTRAAMLASDWQAQSSS